MDFAFSEDQQLFQRTLREFARTELLPRYRYWDQNREFPTELIRQLGELGVYGLRVPERYGGQAADFLTVGIAHEELARGDFNLCLPLLVTCLGVDALLAFGSEEQQAAWLPGVARGEVTIGIGLTEPNAGSDAAALQLRARRDGDDYIFNGEKSGITCATSADLFIIWARTEANPALRAQGVSAFLVPADAPGLARHKLDDIGSRSTGWGTLSFDDVRLPAGARLGTENKGFMMIMRGFDASRAWLGLMCLGAAQQTLDETAEYVKQRRAFGQPIARFEGVQFPLAEYTGYVEAARLLCYKTLWLRDQGLPHTKEAAICKWWGPELSVQAIHKCLLLHGHYGYTEDYPLGQRLRDVMGIEIGDGTAEIMKIIIAREILGREYLPY